MRLKTTSLTQFSKGYPVVEIDDNNAGFIAVQAAATTNVDNIGVFNGCLI